MISEQRQALIEVGAKAAYGGYLSIPLEVAPGPSPWFTPGGVVVYGPHDCRPKPDWYTQMDLRPVGHWSAMNHEVQVGAMQYWGPDPGAVGVVR